MIPDNQAVERLVDEMLELLEDDAGQKELAEHIKLLGIADAAERIASEVINIVKPS